MNKLNGTHLTKHDRVKIQELLASCSTCRSIASELCIDGRTISKEIKKRRIKERNGKSKFNRSSSYLEKVCPRLHRFPFVCNACKSRSSCTCDYKYFYRAIDAQEAYEYILHDARIGIDMSLDHKLTFDRRLKNGVDKGQSIQHIIANHLDDIKCSPRTVYRLIDRNQTTIQNIDFRRKVRLKKRNHSKVNRSISHKAIEGRTYFDFISFYGANPGIGIVEIDTVEGIKEEDSKCLLTIHFTAFHFMLAFLLDHKRQECVNEVFLYLQNAVGSENYKKLFPVILTDRGSEFFSPDSIEFSSSTGEQLTHVFFCDSYSSYQKGSIEENHTLIRYILPKGFSMKHLVQDDVELMMSHINSYYRKSINSTPLKLMKAFYGDEIIAKLKVKVIDPDLVTSKPTLLK